MTGNVWLTVAIRPAKEKLNAVLTQS